MEAEVLTLADIEAAARRIAGVVTVSPCAESVALSELTGTRLCLKLENLQRTGSFKERGAANFLALLTAEERARGAITASAGNHAQAVALHASRLGIAATVVMPETTPLVKIQSTRRFGATVELFGRSYDEAAGRAEELRQAHGFVYVHPFDDRLVMAGQGTLALELVEQCPDLEAVVVPVGGGGLIAGVACAVKALRPDVRIYGVESRAFPGMKRALESELHSLIPGGKTIADGIAVRRIGKLTTPLVSRFVDDIALVDEEEIAEAILLLFEQEKTVAEGAGAVGLAALVHDRLPLRGKRVALVLSGGNIDVNLMARIIERGLVKSGRLARLELTVPDVAGSLVQVLGVVAEARANVLEINHDRTFSGSELGETSIELVLETFGFQHIEAVEHRLSTAGFVVRKALPRAFAPLAVPASDP
jgi:threonine dehydratase